MPTARRNPSPTMAALCVRLLGVLAAPTSGAAPPSSIIDSDDDDDGDESNSVMAHAFAILLSAAAMLAGSLYVFYPAIKAATDAGGGGATEEDLDGGGTSGSSATEPAPALSLVVPAYNEEERLPIMLGHTIKHLHQDHDAILDRCRSLIGVASAGKSNAPRFEIVFVDDGSKDGTSDVVRKYATSLSDSNRLGSGGGKDIRIRLVHMHRNSGKGAAVRAGMIRSRGDLVLMVDADDATDFPDGLAKVLDGMRRLLKDEGGDGGRPAHDSSSKMGPAPPAAVFGSRAHLEDSSCADRSPVRTFLMHAFHFFVRTLCSHRIKDTQCGFKLFTRSGAAALFSNLHLRRWAFDTELVVVAELLGVPLAEVGVKWHEVEGSKLDTDKLTLAMVSLGMLRDMVCVRACYTLGIWKVTL
mmetsp:Transcript_30839/g.92392  ORF Transcript_30839/g.92392 Transcript_30839/m.92392 type:complete len:413 (-) Transcript_30839:117-1355(-)